MESMLRWKVKEVMEAKKMSKRRLSCLSGISYETISKLCNNPTCGTRIATLDKLAEALEVSRSALIESMYIDRVL